MGVNTDIICQQALTIANKNQIGNYLDSIEFNRYAEIIQREWFNEAYMDDGTNQNAFDNMSILNVETSPLLSSQGRVTTPSDYMHLIGMSAFVYSSQTAFKEINVTIIDDVEYRQMNMSSAFKPNKEFPIAIIKNGYFQVYPKDLATNVTIDYYRQPTTPFWNFAVINTEKVYKATTGGSEVNPNDGGSGSTDFEIPFEHTEDIVQRMVKMFGFEIRDEALVAYDSRTDTPVQ